MKVGQYVIRRQDRRTVLTFIEHLFDDESAWINGKENQQLIAKQEYLDSMADPDGINAWCAKWLSDVQWEQLRQAVSAACHLREKIRQAQMLKTISLSYHAWKILVDLAQQENTTLSNVVINHLGNAHFADCSQTETDYNRNNLNQDNPSMNA